MSAMIWWAPLWKDGRMVVDAAMRPYWILPLGTRELTDEEIGRYLPT